MLTKLAAPLLLAAGYAALAVPSQAQPAAFGGPKILIHGNYCGPGNNAPLPPIDALDAACARHDACTPQGGLPTEACNLRLQQDAALIARDPRQPEKLRSMAGLIAATATLIPSESGPQRMPAAFANGAGPGAYASSLPAHAPDAGVAQDDDGDDADAD
ncbi:hypothetical protein SAMN05216360_108244 [Methylobacterium phyllostachyos]|uniref:Phospholipase A2 n=1 Tax=Methylobacterium phyllostachyos TaxID=582672 RepID=A0A1H0BP04_9HYPH|nr:hypothetical protein [Methylobacterium phyllostachyos]SDN47354.1 hypothetical protein SAMN05216360_108244 [Methylobacterium phyllostachyos]